MRKLKRIIISILTIMVFSFLWAMLINTYSINSSPQYVIGWLGGVFFTTIGWLLGIWCWGDIDG